MGAGLRAAGGLRGEHQQNTSAVRLVGGGLVGVEWAAELAHFCPLNPVVHVVRRVVGAPLFLRPLAGPLDSSWTAVESGGGGEHPNSGGPTFAASTYIEDRWRKAGIDVVFLENGEEDQHDSTRSFAVEEFEIVEVEDSPPAKTPGRFFQKEFIQRYDCTGFSRRPPDFLAPNHQSLEAARGPASTTLLSSVEGRLRCDESLRVYRTDRADCVFPHIFVCGDLLLRTGARNRAQNAYNAEAAGKIVAHNILVDAQDWTAVNIGGGEEEDVGGAGVGAAGAGEGAQSPEPVGGSEGSRLLQQLPGAGGQDVERRPTRPSKSLTSLLTRNKCCRRRMRTFVPSENLFSDIVVCSLGPEDGLVLLRWPCRKRHSVFLWGKAAAFVKEGLQWTKMAAYRRETVWDRLCDMAWSWIPHY